MGIKRFVALGLNTQIREIIYVYSDVAVAINVRSTFRQLSQKYDRESLLAPRATLNNILYHEREQARCLYHHREQARCLCHKQSRTGKMPVPQRVNFIVEWARKPAPNQVNN
jgi:hypothetical protein